MNYLEQVFGLQDRRIVVTGAGGLLGTVFSQALARAGAELVLIDKDKNALELCGTKLNSIDVSPELIVCDLTNYENVYTIINDIGQRGSIDGQVNSPQLIQRPIERTLSPVMLVGLPTTEILVFQFRC